MRLRDTTFDGLFFVCVKSTGIFCRPSCPARKPLAHNVVFHATVRDCLLDGFRPCKRCRPLANNGDSESWLDALLRRVEAQPGGRLSDAQLSAMGISPHRVRRYFTRNFDMTFQAYHRARRMGLALTGMRAGNGAAAAAHDASFESLSGFRDAFKRVFGTTPGRCDALTCIRTTRIETPLGPLVAGATDEGLCLLEFADRRGFAAQVETMTQRMQGAIVPGDHPLLDQAAKELEEYFDGVRRDFSVPINAPGTVFQATVWSALRAIPYGETLSYIKLATHIGRPGAQRAVGRANGENRLAIIIPCHRVVRDDGTLCGYGGGLWRKKFLLDLERKVACGIPRSNAADPGSG